MCSCRLLDIYSVVCWCPESSVAQFMLTRRHTRAAINSPSSRWKIDPREMQILSAEVMKRCDLQTFWTQTDKISLQLMFWVSSWGVETRRQRSFLQNRFLLKVVKNISIWGKNLALTIYMLQQVSPRGFIATVLPLCLSMKKGKM